MLFRGLTDSFIPLWRPTIAIEHSRRCLVNDSRPVQFLCEQYCRASPETFRQPRRQGVDRALHGGFCCYVPRNDPFDGDSILDFAIWISPTFSTTTTADTMIYAVVMMASLKQYFSYTCVLLCGIPRVTLEGKKEDWEAMLSRLKKLKEYGEETMEWYRLLRPIVSRFGVAYDAPHSTDNLDFWNQVAYVEIMDNGSEELAGWITAFCFFDARLTDRSNLRRGNCFG